MKSLFEIYGRSLRYDPTLDMDPLFLKFDIPAPPQPIEPGQQFVIVYQDGNGFTVDVTRDGKILRSRTGSGIWIPEPEETGTLITCYPTLYPSNVVPPWMNTRDKRILIKPQQDSNEPTTNQQHEEEVNP